MDAERIGKTIQYLRKRIGYTQQELAERIMVSDKAVSKWERGIGIPDISLLQKISIVLDVDIDSLLSGEISYHNTFWKGVLILDDYGTSLLYDKPVFDYLLSYFLLAKVKDVIVYGEDRQIEFLKERYGNGEKLGIYLQYNQLHNNLCDEVVLEKDFLASSNIMVVNGSNFIYGVDLSRFLQRALISKSTFSVLAYVNNDKKRAVSFNDEYIIDRTGFNSVKSKYMYSVLPIMFIKNGVKSLSEFKALNYYDLIDKLTDGKKLAVEIMDKGYVSFCINSYKTLLEASSFVKLVQENTNCVVSCLEEIAYRRGLITLEEAKAASNERVKDYLNEVLSI